jgi:hypothetical protein
MINSEREMSLWKICFRYQVASLLTPGLTIEKWLEGLSPFDQACVISAANQDQVWSVIYAPKELETFFGNN